MVQNIVMVTLSLVFASVILLSAASESVPYMGPRAYLGDFESEPDTQVMMEILAKLGQTIMRANDLEKYGTLSSKRGLDLGLSRGFSGSQAAKHLMGLAAANFAGGPGRRRRHA
ncbi:diuretic hormone class 2 isoform X1 [Cimex lectularius]|uniref:Diuretic hormone class 2 n=1 Tax=Cimex lectularius TaxID=79782 RepID=A0A8I6TMP5_CIMLE|nr:diuretic hormone class 2 isoform X1 [Cimex lectularius]XP_024084760.1 diuretic hormone class 2 isoform X1 [Cimex lectularius]